jgi:long-chain acyl-CoA synthetase
VRALRCCVVFEGAGLTSSVPCSYEWVTYGAAAADRAAIASGLTRLGVRTGERVGLYSINCAEWVLTEGALTRMACVSVPLYDTLGPKAVEYICNHAELVAVACHAAVLATLLESLAGCPTIKLVVVFGPPDRARPAARVPGVTVVSLDAVRAAGHASPLPPVPPAAHDVATICYTSGTTGNPKGVVLTHLNLVSNTASMEDGLHQTSARSALRLAPLLALFTAPTCAG